MFKGVNISIPANEQARFKAWTRSLSKENTVKCKNIIRATTENINRRAKTFAPAVNDHLSNSIRPAYSSDGLSSSVEVGVDYGAYVEFGTGIGVRVAGDVSSYAMTFKGRGIRNVNNIARPYLFPAVRLSVKEMQYELNKMGFK